MAVTVENTPNPNAMKFCVGAPVGGPVTYREPAAAEAAFVKAIFDAGDIVQVFLTADFVSVTKTADADWAALTPPIVVALETAFG